MERKERFYREVFGGGEGGSEVPLRVKKGVKHYRQAYIESLEDLDIGCGNRL
jgi:hypothetical protein